MTDIDRLTEAVSEQGKQLSEVAGNCTNTPSGWLRFSFSFDHMQDKSTDLSGTAISSVRVYINAVGAGYTGSQVSITGVQFAQGTRRPDVYVPKP